MNTNKITILSGLVLLLVTTLFIVIPTVILGTLLLSVSISYSGFYIKQNYDIDYKYWLSFVSQLIGLLLIVSSFVMMMVIIFSLLGSV